MSSDTCGVSRPTHNGSDERLSDDDALLGTLSSETDVDSVSDLRNILQSSLSTEIPAIPTTAKRSSLATSSFALKKDESLSRSRTNITRPTSASESLLYHTSHSSKYLAETVWGVRQVQPITEGERSDVTEITEGIDEEKAILRSQIDNLKKESEKDLLNIFEEEEENKDDESGRLIPDRSESLASPTQSHDDLKRTRSQKLKGAMQRSLSNLANRLACGSNHANQS